MKSGTWNILLKLTKSMIKVDRSRGHFISLTLERHRFSEAGRMILHIWSINTLRNLTANAPHVIGSGYSWVQHHNMNWQTIFNERAKMLSLFIY